MRKPQPGDFVYQVSSLVLAFILVHAFYVIVVRPNAEAVLAEQARIMREDPEYAHPFHWAPYIVAGLDR